MHAATDKGFKAMEVELLTADKLPKGVWIMPGMRFSSTGNITGLTLARPNQLRITNFSIELWHQQDNDAYTKVYGSERNVTFNICQTSLHCNITPPLPYDSGDVLAIKQPGDNSRVRFYHGTINLISRPQRDVHLDVTVANKTLPVNRTLVLHHLNTS